MSGKSHKVHMSIDILSEMFVSVLRKHMLPILQPQQIELCSPTDRRDAFLGVYLYNIMRDNNFQISGRISVDENIKQKPPILVSLYFMVTSYIGIKSGILDDYKILGRVMQIWHDESMPENMLLYQPQIVPPVKVELLSLDMDEKNKIWQFASEQQRLSLYYKVTPVPIVSTGEIKITRVDSVSGEVH